MLSALQRKSANPRFSIGNRSVTDPWILYLDAIASTPPLNLWMLVDPATGLVRHVQHSSIGETVEKQFQHLCNRLVLPCQLFTDNGARRKGGDADARR